jgi:hypothetical protein
MIVLPGRQSHRRAIASGQLLEAYRFGTMLELFIQ